MYTSTVNLWIEIFFCFNNSIFVVVVDHLKILVNKAYSSLTCPKIFFCVPNEALTKSIKKRSRLILSLSTVAEIYFDPKQSLRITQFALSEDWQCCNAEYFGLEFNCIDDDEVYDAKNCAFFKPNVFLFWKEHYPLTI